MTKFIERIWNWYNDDEQEGLREELRMYSTFGGIMFGLLTIAYWLGHPEWILNKRCCDMIVKNCSK